MLTDEQLQKIRNDLDLEQWHKEIIDELLNGYRAHKSLAEENARLREALQICVDAFNCMPTFHPEQLAYCNAYILPARERARTALAEVGDRQHVD